MAKYDLQEELSLYTRTDRSRPTDGEEVWPGYPLSYLRGECLRTYVPSLPIRKLIAAYLVRLA
ncbi:hypothetical protein C8Q76DRAFT_798373 [Earliella scabrosa]|nr:hypothetical protein C8Q76DRAFT_798373 [Earliella scabrosa]